ncbi:jg27705 [Pararge aegeria aegeria]|uniref:Jg27705 protein n=1 Tax=Pararge aegeria aegeria TaxID=348720 RepID=A0A8S4R537_9NEOP|nr:jg27705 [Pararge aegeria aegeria]
MPLKLVTPKELIRTIRNLENKKAPGFDLITGEILKHLPMKTIVFLTMLFNAIMRVQYYPIIWKISHICMIPKPGKVPTEPSSYRPISLLPIISKVFEKILLNRMKPILIESHIMPDHQFGFREQHSTVEQGHRVAHKIRETLERKEYCSAVFLDIQQAFDRVWHEGLLYKLKTLLPNSLYMILKSYLSGRKYQVKFEDELSNIYNIKASVPQGSVLGPILYSIYTADLPSTSEVETATYADDTACLASDIYPDRASQKLQIHLDKIDQWLSKWRIKYSASKSKHITFTLHKDTMVYNGWQRVTE